MIFPTAFFRGFKVSQYQTESNERRLSSYYRVESHPDRVKR